MDITQLRYFLKTAETLNYTRAAEGLFITRQSLRQAIANLEEEIGAPLFENEKNHLSLTEYGAYLAFAGRDIVARFDGMAAELTRMARQEITLRAAFSESLFPFMLPDLDGTVRDFRAKYPHIPLTVEQLPADRVVEKALAGELDCGLLMQMPTPRPGCDVQVLRRFPVGVDSGPDSPLFGMGNISLADLARVPLVGMGSLERIARPLWEDCQKQGFALDYKVMPNTVDAFYHIQHSLASGLDIYFEDDSVPAHSSRLPGYVWELAFLLPEASPARGMALLFCRFLEERYQENME